MANQRIYAAILLLLTGGYESVAQEKKPAEKKAPDLTTAFAATDPDFKIQGEYTGTVAGKEALGAQVVARGNGNFEVYFLSGGLPGAGWDTKMRSRMKAQTGKDGVVSLFSKAWTGGFKDGVLSGKTAKGEPFQVQRVERKSPTLDEKPPAGAVVLFDGKNLDHWNKAEMVEGNLLYRGTNSKTGFATGKLHLEFRTPYQPKASGQGRGNSGVYLLGREIQVLDSFGLNGVKDECGAFYGNAAPSVNMCFPPLTWQTYDVEIKADEKDTLRATVWHNGVKIHENHGMGKKGAKPASINLQNHGNPVVYRNIWFVEGK